MMHAERSEVRGVTCCGKIIAECGQLPRAGHVLRAAITAQYDASNLCSECRRALSLWHHSRAT